MKKKFSTSGFTAAGVLVLALAAGGVGGALVSGGSSAPAGSPAVSVDQVSEEATVGPTSTPIADAATEQSPELVREADAPSPVAPVRAAEPVADRSAADSAANAEASAQKSEKAARRAEDAADRAETPAAPKPAVPVAEPVPAPVAKTCDGKAEGTTRGVPMYGEPNWKGGSPGEDTCMDGKWVRTKEVVNPTPPPKEPVRNEP